MTTGRETMIPGMILNPTSSAPHIWPVAQWDQFAPRVEGKPLLRELNSQALELVLHIQASPVFEVGIRRFSEGSFRQVFEFDELRYFFVGRGLFRADKGEVIQVEPGTAVHFKQGWSGTAEIEETLDASYVRCAGGPSDHTPVLHNVATAGPLKEWGPVSKPLSGSSQTAGILLSREPDRHAESGVWTCTPGLWRCELKSDEFCHFLQGSSTYTHDSGEVIEVRPDTLAYFPMGWKGECRVHETVRKVYIIR